MLDGVKLPRVCHGLGQPSCCLPAGQGSLGGLSPWSPAHQHPNASVQTQRVAQGLEGCPWRPAGTHSILSGHMACVLAFARDAE